MHIRAAQHVLLPLQEILHDIRLALRRDREARFVCVVDDADFRIQLSGQWTSA
jgi:CHAD domain-containing protein